MNSKTRANGSLARRLAEPEKEYARQCKAVFEAICGLMFPPAHAKKQIGFTARENSVGYAVKAHVSKGEVIVIGLLP